jgi:hypothetical protein
MVGHRRRSYNIGGETHRRRQARYRERDREQGTQQVNVRVPDRWSDEVRSFAKLLREGATPDFAFREAFGEPAAR